MQIPDLIIESRFFRSLIFFHTEIFILQKKPNA